MGFKRLFPYPNQLSPNPRRRWTSIFRINLLNGQNFTLEYNERTWVAQVEGKKYYLLNLDEEERAAQSIGRILSYGPTSGADVDGADSSGTEPEEEIEDEA